MLLKQLSDRELQISVGTNVREYATSLHEIYRKGLTSYC